MKMITPLATVWVLMMLAAVEAQQDVVRCMPDLVGLTACGAFVQGSERSPARECCESLSQINSVRPDCLCTVLNHTDALSSLPINASLALQLPLLCALPLDLSLCSSSGLNDSPGSPESQVSLGSTSSNSTTAVNSTITHVPNSPNNASHQNFGTSQAMDFKSNQIDFSALLIIVALISSVLIEVNHII